MPFDTAQGYEAIGYLEVGEVFKEVRDKHYYTKLCQVNKH